MGGGWRRLDRRGIDGIRGKGGNWGKKRGGDDWGHKGERGELGERGGCDWCLCCMGGLYGACGGLREYIWPADAVHVGVAAQRAENEGVRR